MNADERRCRLNRQYFTIGHRRWAGIPVYLHLSAFICGSVPRLSNRAAASTAMDRRCAEAHAI
jgi:hypothetical protein